MFYTMQTQTVFEVDAIVSFFGLPVEKVGQALAECSLIPRPSRAPA